MPVSNKQFRKLLSIVDTHAQREHSVDGSVAAALHDVLIAHEQMVLRRVARDLAELGPKYKYLPGDKARRKTYFQIVQWLHSRVIRLKESAGQVNHAHEEGGES